AGPINDPAAGRLPGVLPAGRPAVVSPGPPPTPDEPPRPGELPPPEAPARPPAPVPPALPAPPRSLLAAAAPEPARAAPPTPAPTALAVLSRSPPSSFRRGFAAPARSGCLGISAAPLRPPPAVLPALPGVPYPPPGAACPPGTASPPGVPGVENELPAIPPPTDGADGA